jgi:hypothetical protein
MALALIRTGTLRQMGSTAEAPQGATHMTVWRAHDGREATVYERGNARYRLYCWDGTTWVARDSHAQAWINMSKA